MSPRSLTSRAITPADLTPAVAELIREQGTLHGLVRDPLPEVTHGLRADEDTTKSRLFRSPRTERRTFEMLLTPDLLLIVYRGGDDAVIDRSAHVNFHRLHQIEFSVLPAQLLARARDASIEIPEGLMSLVSTPVGGTERGSRSVPIGTGTDATLFRDALVAAVERARRGSGV